MLNADQASSTAGQASHLILRNNALYGGYSPTAHMQGIYLDNWSSYTLEDNVFYHNGWKIGASRDDDPSIGGPTIFRHPIYAQDDTSGITRRNLIVDGAADGGSVRGDVFYSENLVIDCPIGVGAGGGLTYNAVRPSGVNIEISYNAFLGDADINSSNPRGMGMTSMNGRSGSSAHHNLWARSRNPNGVNNYTFITQADQNLPSYMDYHDNVAYLWASAIQTYLNGGNYPTQDFATYNNNIWDALTSGTNKNISAGTFPNPYTAAQLYSALGYADKQAFINYAIEHPEAHIQRQARALLFSGYGIN